MTKFDFGWRATVVLLMLGLSFEVYGSPISRPGSTLNYTCKSGKNKNCVLSVYGERNGVSSFVSNCGDIGEIDRDTEVWQYISGLFGRSADGDLLRLLSLKSGDLKNANNPLEGRTYQGIVNYWDRRGTYDMDVKISLGKAAREKTPLGVQVVLPVTTTIKNSDGKGGTATVLVAYVPAMKVKLSEKIEGSLSDQNWDCMLTSLKYNPPEKARKEFHLEMPKSGTTLKYQCEGKVKVREIKMIDNKSGQVTYTVTRDGASTSSVVADDWQIYAGLVKKVEDPGKKTLMDFVSSDAGALSQPNLPAGSYFGQSVIQGPPKVDFHLRLSVRPKQAYVSKEFGPLDVVPVFGYRSRISKKIVRTQYYYSDQLKAPVWYKVQDRQDPTRDQTCRLIAHSSGTSPK